MFSTVSEISKEIERGKALLLAGAENQLRKLPKGNWIAGTIPYFMTEDGGTVSMDRIYCTELPAEAACEKITEYGESTIQNITADACEDGFSFIIIPATSPVHVRYASDAPDFKNIFVTPILGWISGVLLDDLGNISPKVFNGKTGRAMDDKAVVMHCSLAAGKIARIGIVNVFSQGGGASIKFSKEGFSAGTCLINGEEQNLAEYIRNSNIDTKLPLVANYSGANVNVSIQDVEEDVVNFYAPVFREVEYKFAEPVPSYVQHFQEALPKGVKAAFSCNCILNFLYSELEGKITQGMYGPITFGEVAYQLLNQTLVYLEIL